jgi:hypothetical protein
MTWPSKLSGNLPGVFSSFKSRHPKTMNSRTLNTWFWLKILTLHVSNHIHNYTYIYIHVYVYPIYAHKYEYVYIYIYMFMYIYILYIHMYMCTRIYPRVRYPQAGHLRIVFPGVQQHCQVVRTWGEFTDRQGSSFHMGFRRRSWRY